MLEQKVALTKSPILDEAIVQKFKASFRGELIRPGDAGYEEACKIWKGMIDKHPALIARCTGATDVINAVNFARTEPGLTWAEFDRETQAFGLALPIFF